MPKKERVLKESKQLKGNVMNEQRKLQRFDIRVEASVSLLGPKATVGSYRYYTKDISSIGVFLLSEYPMVIGQDLDLAFSVPLQINGEAARVVTLLKTTGQVIRSEKNGVAVLFHDPVEIAAT